MFAWCVTYEQFAHSFANVIDLIKFVGQELKTSKEKLV
jgi:hypothetical protein